MFLFHETRQRSCFIPEHASFLKRVNEKLFTYQTLSEHLNEEKSALHAVVLENVIVASVIPDPALIAGHSNGL